MQLDVKSRFEHPHIITKRGEGRDTKANMRDKGKTIEYKTLRCHNLMVKEKDLVLHESSVFAVLL